MIPSLRPAIRERIQRVSRRDVLRWTGAVSISAGTWVGCETVKELAVRSVEAVLADDDPVPHMRMDLGMREFERLASWEQKATLAAVMIGATIPDSAAGRCSKAVERDGDMWVVDQGREAGAILWGRPVVGRMADRPDRAFGRWRSECIRAASLRSDPTFELVRAVANGRPHRYTALIIPGRENTIITAPEPTISPPSAQSTAPTTARAT